MAAGMLLAVTAIVGVPIDSVRSFSPGDRLICRGPGDCRLYRPGKDSTPATLEGALPVLKDALVIRAPDLPYSVRIRAVLAWPDLAVNILR